MLRVSTVPQCPPHGGDVHRFRVVSATLVGALSILAVYLFREVQANGDGAVYVLQAADGSAWDRSVHVGFLAPLWVWVRSAGAMGLGPSPAANVLCAAWTFSGLGAAAALSRELLRAVDPSDGARVPPLATLLAPATLLGAATVWHSALFCEVYGPLAATTTATAWALRRNRDALAAGAMALAILIHPGAIALGPGLLLLGGVRDRRRALFVAGPVLVLTALAVTALSPDWWTGGRGLLTAPPPDRSLLGGLQAAWRLLSRDLGAASLPILVGSLVAASTIGDRTPGLRGALWAIPVLAIGAAVGLSRWSDNPGQLPTLFAAAAFAPFALRAPFGPSEAGRRLARSAPALWILLAALGVAEATSRHDATARRAVAESEKLAETCAESEGAWSVRMRRSLACRPD
jgi:hypothetical protein